MRRLLFALVLPFVLSCDDAVAGLIEPLTEATVTTTSGLRFSPASVELAVGGTVTFAINAVGHTVTFTNATGVPASIPLSFNAQIPRVFNTAGTFVYHCEIHPTTMIGTIIVR